MAYRMYRMTRPYNAEAFLLLHYRAGNDVGPYNAEAPFSICIIGPEMTSDPIMQKLFSPSAL